MAQDNIVSSRDKVLKVLEEGRGTYISGGRLSESAGISRTAVWKAVSRLRSEGYVIDAVTNRGYCLALDNDILSQSSIRKYMEQTAHQGSLHEPEIEVFDTVGSTNAICMSRASSGNRSEYIAVAGCQSSGRGRRGRSFFSPEGTGLYMSLLISPDNLTSDMAVRLTTIAAVAAAEAVEEVSGRQALIKWVNDVFIGGRKVCGILTEASFNPEDGTLDYAVIGIGINVYEPEGGFPAEIRDTAGSVAGPSAADRIIRSGGRNLLAAEIITRFYAYYDREFSAEETSDASSHHEEGLKDNFASYREEYRKRCFVTGMDVLVMKTGSSGIPARVLGVDDECRLIVRYQDGTETVLSSGEISISLQGQN